MLFKWLQVHHSLGYAHFIHLLAPFLYTVLINITPHFVPEGISSSLRDFVVLFFNIEVFQIKFSWK